MFLQALLLPSPIQRSFLQMQEDIVKGCKAKCVERANESKYQNLGPFFSQGENGPDTSCTRGHPREHSREHSNGSLVWDYNTEKANFCEHSRVHLRERSREHLREPFRGSIGGS